MLPNCMPYAVPLTNMYDEGGTMVTVWHAGPKGAVQVPLAVLSTHGEGQPLAPKSNAVVYVTPGSVRGGRSHNVILLLSFSRDTGMLMRA